ncbi:class I fructose-bisphosphate aldolase, partial [Desulfovibrio desulfuricans]|nr:class I fructose-bisphosphate aldolase [Desulfovibrio desulfuricans]
HIFGTKMRSIIKESNTDGIRAIVEQQFAIGKRICATGLVPILEPEVDINAADKADCEILLKAEIKKHLALLQDDEIIMFKLSIPSVDGFYSELMEDPHVLRVVALSGGYTRDEANARLARNPGLIASFSRALSQGLSVTQ